MQILSSDDEDHSNDNDKRSQQTKEKTKDLRSSDKPMSAEKGTKIESSVRQTGDERMSSGDESGRIRLSQIKYCGKQRSAERLEFDETGIEIVLPNNEFLSQLNPLLCQSGVKTDYMQRFSEVKSAWWSIRIWLARQCSVLPVDC